MTMTAPDQAAERRDALVGRLFEATLGAFDLLAIHLGDRARPVPGARGARPADRRRSSRPRPASPRATPASGSSSRRSPPSSRSTTSTPRPTSAATRCRRATRRSSSTRPAPPPMAPMAQWVVAGGKSMADLVDAYRTGGGVPWDRLRRTSSTAQDRHEPAAVHATSSPRSGSRRSATSTPGSAPRAAASPTSRCGTGWSTIALARGYPKVAVDGLDLDRGSIADRPGAPRERCDGRRRPGRRSRPGTRAIRDSPGRYDLALIVEAVHDMAHPVAGRCGRPAACSRRAERCSSPTRRSRSRSTRPATRSSGSCTATASCSACRTRWPRPTPSGPGPCCAPDRMRELAAEAGFSSVTIVPIEHDTVPLLPPRPVAPGAPA